MPEISRFYGIVIKMFFDDHLPSHFHAFYGEYEILINVGTLSVVAGDFPPRAFGLLMEWTSMHQGELMALWEKAVHLEPLGKIDPLP
ncbi:MAG: DUF4160 domain-containing protein [Deltaproteobacteria bacterium]|nr:DUF4160 domain-containing protein [Deltaproteobacteria bacterium]